MDRFAIQTAGNIRPYYDTIVKINTLQWKNEYFKDAWKKFDPSLYAFIDSNLLRDNSVEVKIPGLDKDEIIKNVFNAVKYVDYDQEITPPLPVSSTEYYEDECKDAKTGYLTEYEAIKAVLGEEALTTHDRLRVYTFIINPAARLKKYAMDNNVVINFSKEFEQKQKAKENELKQLENELNRKLEELARHGEENIPGYENEDEHEKIDKVDAELTKKIFELRTKISEKRSKLAIDKNTYSDDFIKENLNKRFNDFYNRGQNDGEDIKTLWRRGVPFYTPKEIDLKNKEEEVDLENLRLFQEKYKKYVSKKQEIEQYKTKLEKYNKLKQEKLATVLRNKQEVTDYLLTNYKRIPDSSLKRVVISEEKAGSLYDQKRIKV
jgi:hypothetical protein